MKRCTTNVPDSFDIVGDDDVVFCTIDSSPLYIKAAIVAVAKKEHTSPHMAAQRFVNRALREGLAAVKAREALS